MTNMIPKEVYSFNQITPSKDMSTEQYMVFWSVRPPSELEVDYVSTKTYYKICEKLNLPIPKPFPPSIRYFS